MLTTHYSMLISASLALTFLVLPLQGQDAQDFLDKHPLVLTKEQALNLSDLVMKQHFDEVQQMYNHQIGEASKNIQTCFSAIVPQFNLSNLRLL